MREKRVLAVVLAALSCAFFATACGGDKKPEEQHEYVYYKASDPTCTEKGKVERVCIKCGAKDYLEIEALGHIYKNGVCTRCGAEENYAPACDVSRFYTADRAYGIAKKYNYELTEEEFYANLSRMQVDKIYVGAFGRVKAIVSGMSVDLGDVRIDYAVNSETPLSTVVKAWVADDNLIVLNSAGTQTAVGKLAALTSESGRKVSGLLISKENVLVALFSDDTVAPLGLISMNENDTTASELVFGYGDGIVIGPFDRNITAVTVPYSHMGTAITRIKNGAFRGCRNLASAEISSDRVVIGGYAFSGCSALRWIVLPANTEVYYGAFDGCTLLSKVFYKGTPDEWRVRFILGGNEALTRATVYYYSETVPAAAGNYWHYVSGVPTVW